MKKFHPQRKLDTKRDRECENMQNVKLGVFRLVQRPDDDMSLGPGFKQCCLGIDFIGASMSGEKCEQMTLPWLGLLCLWGGGIYLYKLAASQPATDSN
jgi:hypothetical protein